MSESVVGIHPIHRKLAAITLMSTDQHGAIVIGMPELQLIIPLLRQNLALIRRLDELKALSFHAFEMGDMDWQMEICAQIESLERTLEV
jgi:hypothetical protein